MHVTTTSAALRVAARPWPTARGGWTLSLVCKATYRLQPGECPLHDVPEPLYEDDTHWDDDPTRSLAVASDLAPFKPRADVLLVGSAFAPRRQPARSIAARLITASIDKSLEAWADRAWTQDGLLREGPRVTKVSLRYERAAGGPGSWNPVGVRPDAQPTLYGQVPLPNLQPMGLHITRREDFIEPIGFGPIAPTWPSRRERLGGRAGTWRHERWWEQPLPEGFDLAFFNIAPLDQQVTELRHDERLVLEHLHPDHPRLVTNLPGLRPRAMAERPGAAPEEVALRSDTLCIDTDRALCTLVWRGWLPLRHADEPGCITLSAERPSTFRLSKQTIVLPAADEDDEAGRTLHAPLHGLQPASVLPFVSRPPTEPRPPVESGATGASRGELPASPPQTPLRHDRDDDEDTIRTLPPMDPSRGDAVAPRGRTEALLFQTESAPLATPADANVLPFRESVPALGAVTKSDRDQDRPASPPPAASVVPDVPALTAAPFQRGLAEEFPVSWHRVQTPQDWPPITETAPRVLPPPPPMIGPLSRPDLLTHEPTPEEQLPAQTVATPASEATSALPLAPPPPPLADVSLERCAALTARIARNKAKKAEILEEEALSDRDWSSAERRWAEAIRAETSRGKHAQLRRFDAAYVSQLEQERGPIEPEEYARISVAGERGALDDVLADLDLPRGSIMRIERVWLHRMATEPATAERVRVAIDTMREEG
ncbi:DUF2169 family type VI secretion system accessory protein [Chondromyces crocatus]|uniref:DUF2169 domain-containing protein n=1 Tax=Chondromyces crocatus TaxID=52 RepID=A0A0K1ECU5_CHOCO|nr:DUF2169 domain-containing protein [Chondromyces crocatus]AKT38691.1 uncharacterized protein CMC5_028390 [Chondromyces crocatus]